MGNNKFNWRRMVGYIVSIIFILVGLGFGWMRQYASDFDRLYQKNEVYGVSDKLNVAIRVYEILGEVGSQENSKNTLYVVRHEHGYAGFIASSDDAAIQPLLNSEVSEEGIVFVVRQERSPSDVESILRKSVAGSEIASQMNYSKVASLADFQKGQMAFLYTAIGCGLFGVVIIFSIFRMKRKENKQVEDLYIQFPELRDNLELLNTEASYSDSLLGIYVYKSYLIYKKVGFAAVDLSAVDWLYHSITTIYSGFFSQKTYQLLFFSYTQKKQIITLSIKRKEDPEVNIQALYSYLAEEYPEMLIGVDKKAIFNERKKAQR